jgi:CBS domain containing-hemolysin-like protein
MAIEDFRREYPELPEISGVDTMGGLLVRQVEMVPPAGRTASFAGLRLTAAVVDERRVKELLVEKPRKK